MPPKLHVNNLERSKKVQSFSYIVFENSLFRIKISSLKIRESALNFLFAILDATEIPCY